ncbi:MAG: TRAP transporter small permease subunit [Gammaproteobacteria bacterium]|nr:TRAP transporter small permease subunit [Gammaproteobacteria bacterium]
MNSLLDALADRIDGLNRRIGRTIAWLALVMALLAFAVVVLRYAFDLGWIGLQEAVLYLHAALFMLGIPYVLQADGHVRIDLIYRRLGDKGRAWVDLGGSLLLLLPLAGFLLWSSWDYVAESWRLKESSGEAGGLPWVYLLKSLIPLMALLLGLQGLSLAIRSLRRLRGESS